MNKKKIFLAAPISGFSDENEYREYREKVLNLIMYLRKNSFDVYSEVERVIGKSNYDSPGDSVEDDFKKISDVDIFLLLHPKKSQTSALIELGYAYAKEKTIVIVGPTVALPYLAVGLPLVSKSVSVVDSCDLDVETFIRIVTVLTELV